VLPPQTLPVWLADPAMLTDSLAIVRALKPLLQKVDAGFGKRLDEPATVENIARTGLVLPILEAEQEPWFDIILVVDRGSSMHIWQRLVQDLERILRRHGAFRDLRVFDLVINSEAITADDRVLFAPNPQRPGHRPKELIDQRGQRLVIVLSDCAGTYWWDGTLLPMLQVWGAIMPTVVWQMLPPWMWKRTALGRGSAVALSNDVPGVANQRLKVQIQERREPEDAAQRISVPVVTSEVSDLTRWSLMVAGDRHQITPGFLLPQRGGSVPRAKTYEEIAKEHVQQHSSGASDADLKAALNQALDTLARERVERFLALASPEAQRLIMLLAAAPVITMPVVRLIRDAMLYDVPSPLPVAEVFLSGLLQRLPGQDRGALEQVLEQEHEQAQAELQDLAPLDEDAVPPVQLTAQDLVQYDFAPGVRPVLLEFLPAIDTIEVINSVSAAVERRWNKVSNQNFRAFLTNPQMQVPEELAGLRSFASITADILEQLGGEYGRFAQQLRGDLELPPGGTDLSDFPLQTFEYEVAEFINFPPFEPFNFIEAQFDEDAFPPPLQAEEFTIITFEVQQDAEDNEGLESFEFTVATLERQDLRPQRQRQEQITEWEILRQQQLAYRFIEPLPGDIPLEMVAIPAGTFLMGSPDDEPERNADRESPQHEVTVESFFMGRYPVTQAQWRVVAAMPEVTRKLDRDPSRFKGDNRPVEKVSWDDAVEFCARLSAHTGREYRLPSEAEWEYACRADTTTPFHFGETITSERANYDGTTSYADGPRGEYRRETTVVDQFDVANAFGLTDMHGNIFQWCQDRWHDNYDGAPTDGSAWQEGGDLSTRVRRGGSWINGPRNCRSASRLYFNPVDRDYYGGFRVCCTASRKQATAPRT
jgi:formylglycine-generating enzyme required for sulfatase activity